MPTSLARRPRRLTLTIVVGCLAAAPRGSFVTTGLCSRPHARLSTASPLSRRPVVCQATPPDDGNSRELRVRSFQAQTPRAARDGHTLFGDRIRQLRALSASHGHALVSADHPDASLVRWARRQRSLRRSGALSADAIEELEEVGFVWDPNRHAWFERYDELVALRSSSAPLPAKLARWAARQRLLFRQGKLEAERLEALSEIDFEFDPERATWERRLAEYAAAISGGGRIGAPLASWASRQRRKRRLGQLDAEKAEALEQLEGWTWEARAGPTSRLSPPSIFGGGGARDEAGSARRAAVAYPPCRSAGRALLVSIGRRRRGAADELEDAREALLALGYGVTTVENPSSSELVASLVAHRSLDGWGGHASSVVALMAHGVGEGRIECEDGREANLAALFAMLGPSAAPTLAGKPKIWLVQACRSGETSRLGPAAASTRARHTDAALGLADSSPVAAADADGPGPTSLTPLVDSLSEEVDHLWGFATSAGSPAYRGAMFAALRMVVKEHGRGTSWLELLQYTNHRLSSARVGAPSATPAMEICSTCRGAAFSPADLELGAESRGG